MMNRPVRSWIALAATAAAVASTAAAGLATPPGAGADTQAGAQGTTEVETVEKAAEGQDTAKVEEAKVTTKITIKRGGVRADQPLAKDEVKAVEKKEAAKPAAKAGKIVIANKVAAPAQNLDPWIQQMTPQLRPMVRAHLHLISSACSPTPEQRKAFAADGERVLKEVARECAAAQTGQGQPGHTTRDPNQLIADALGAAIKDQLTPEQWARYEVEAKARSDARRRLVVQNLVSSLDDELVLSPDQRARIVGAMEANYDESWCSTLQILMYGTQFFPNVADHLIIPTLTPAQKATWTKRTRNGTMAWWNFGHNGNAVMIEDEPAPDPTPNAEAPKVKDVEKVAPK